MRTFKLILVGIILSIRDAFIEIGKLEIFTNTMAQNIAAVYSFIFTLIVIISYITGGLFLAVLWMQFQTNEILNNLIKLDQSVGWIVFIVYNIVFITAFGLLATIISINSYLRKLARSLDNNLSD